MTSLRYHCAVFGLVWQVLLLKGALGTATTVTAFASSSVRVWLRRFALRHVASKTNFTKLEAAACEAGAVPAYLPSARSCLSGV